MDPHIFQEGVQKTPKFENLDELSRNSHAMVTLTHVVKCEEAIAYVWSPLNNINTVTGLGLNVLTFLNM